MPGVDGLTVSKYVRSFDVNHPVIIYTGDTNPKTEREVRAMGITEFILKNFPLLTDVLQRPFQDSSLGNSPGSVTNTSA